MWTMVSSKTSTVIWQKIKSYRADPGSLEPAAAWCREMMDSSANVGTPKSPHQAKPRRLPAILGSFLRKTRRRNRGNQRAYFWQHRLASCTTGHQKLLRNEMLVSMVTRSVWNMFSFILQQGAGGYPLHEETPDSQAPEGFRDRV